jgi:Family of unknown function (DUF5641)
MRRKWFDKSEPLKIGDLVFIADEDKRDSWRRGVIDEIIVGSNDQVRSVKVRTSTGILLRPVVKVIPLGVNCDCPENP